MPNEGCVNLSTALGALTGLAVSVGTLLDFKREGISTYDPTTGTVVKAVNIIALDVPALQISGGQLQQGGDSGADKNVAIMVIAGADVDFEPSVGDRVEVPAASIRTGSYKSLRVIRVDDMVIGGSVFQYTLTLSD